MTARMVREGVVHGMPDREYHLGPELSSTGARHILDSPARYAWRKEHPERTPAMSLGRLIHLKVLGAGPAVVTVPQEHLTPAGKISDKQATREWRAEQEAAGVTLVAPVDLARADTIAAAVLKHEGARRLLERPGDNEVSVFATDPDTGVRCRARYDRLGDGLAVDLKTTSGTASPHSFGAAAARYGYAIQEAFYADTLQWATGTLTPPMCFIVVETSPPHLVSVQVLPEDVRLIATDRAAEARRIYAECAETDTWPAYGTDVIEARVPGWWLYQNDDSEVELAL